VINTLFLILNSIGFGIEGFVILKAEPEKSIDAESPLFNVFYPVLVY